MSLNILYRFYLHVTAYKHNSGTFERFKKACEKRYK